MANLGKLYTVKIRIENAFYETILPEPMVEDISSRGVQSYVVQHIKQTPAKYYVVGKYSKPVELVEVKSAHLKALQLLQLIQQVNKTWK